MRRYLRAEILLGKGQRAVAAGDAAAALAAYDRALDICPDYAPAHLYRAISLSAQQDYAQAAASVQKAVSLDPHRPAYRLVQGMVAYDAGDISRALASFEETERQSPGNRLAAAYARLSALRRDLPEPDTGDLEALDALMASTNTAFQVRWLVLCESALHDCRPPARTLAEQTIFDAFVAPLKEADPGLRERLSHRLSRWKASLGAFTPARRRALTLQRQADERLVAGDCDGALAAMAEALSRRPGAEALRDKYLDLCLYCGHFDPILEAIGTPAQIAAWESDPRGCADTDAWLLAMLGIVRFQQQAFDEAARLLEAAADDDPLDFSAPYFIGAARIATRAPDAARAWFQRALSVPNPGVARMRLAEWRRCLAMPPSDMPPGQRF